MKTFTIDTSYINADGVRVRRDRLGECPCEFPFVLRQINQNPYDNPGCNFDWGKHFPNATLSYTCTEPTLEEKYSQLVKVLKRKRIVAKLLT